MKYAAFWSLVGAMCIAAAPATSLAGQADAVADCERAVTNDYRFSDARDSRAQEVGRDQYVVSGVVKTQDNRDHRYNCRYEYGEVVSYSATDATVAQSKSNTAAAVGAGVIGLAAIAAIAKHEDDEKHRKNRDSYSRGEYYAFNDRNYLTQECSRELRAHIDRDHGKVASIDLQAPYVHDRVMTGTGEVYFRNGGSRELRYTCSFDRSGQVYDGRYSYVGAGYPGYSTYSPYDYRGDRGKGSSEYERGYRDGKHGNEFDSYRHPQDYKDGFRDGERARWND